MKKRTFIIPHIGELDKPVLKVLKEHPEWWGESNRDSESLENLKVYGNVIYQLVCDLANKHIRSLNRYEGSVKTLNARYGLWIECINSAIEDSISEMKKEKK